MADKDMYARQYQFAAMPEDLSKLSKLELEVANVVKEFNAIVSADEIVDQIIPNYKKELKPNISGMSVKNRMRKATELLGLASRIKQIDAALNKLIRIGCVKIVK